MTKLLALITSTGLTVMLAMTSSFVSAQQNAQDKDKTTQQLTEVQQAIANQKLAIENVSDKRKSLEQQLRKDDLAIGKVAKDINDTEAKLAETSARLTDLKAEQTQLTAKKKTQEQLLAAQLRSAYSSGQSDYLKTLLNQENPADIQRASTYYQYLNDARIKEIDAFEKILADLLQVTTQVITEQETLEGLRKQQAKQKLALQKTKRDRKKTLNALSAELQSSQQQLAQLEAEEQNLVAALQKLAEIARAAIEHNGLSKLKRKLYWPTQGKIRRSFGSKKQGYLRWKGVVISAKQGAQVKAIHNGTVLFSDWLKGYGLVTVIDHGDGYMSLYGHNQSLLKNVGDRVETGEPIALVGQSGGQQQSGLYFEIRHQGKAVNPKLWCK